jgi:hypothetical protein
VYGLKTLFVTASICTISVSFIAATESQCPLSRLFCLSHHNLGATMGSGTTIAGSAGTTTTGLAGATTAGSAGATTAGSTTGSAAGAVAGAAAGAVAVAGAVAGAAAGAVAGAAAGTLAGSIGVCVEASQRSASAATEAASAIDTNI